jgi:hypothetical protein
MSVQSIDLRIIENVKLNKIENLEKNTNMLSWADLIEEEIKDNMSNKLINSPTNNNSNTNKNEINLDDLTKINIVDNAILKIMDYEIKVVSYLKSIIKNNQMENKFDYDIFLNKINWIHNVEEFYMKKFDLPLISHFSKSEKHLLPRSSYKFCEYNYECGFHYGKNKKKKGCYAQHYVHNYLCADIKEIINYIELIKTKNELPNFSELLKCINTLNYVINHMKDELEHSKHHIIKK